MSTDARLFFPATQRNREPLVEVLTDVFAPPVGAVLELACGSGEHAAAFAPRLPWLRWLPTDAEPAHVASAEAWRAATSASNLLSAVRYDVLVGEPPAGPFDAIFAANLVHISPPELPAALFAAARRVVRPGGLVVTYGAYTIDGQHTAPSNVAFDAHLKQQDPRWGVRDLADLERVAEGFTLERRIPMPANNFVLVYRRG